MAQIELEHLTKTFAGGVTAVDDVSLTIGDGEFVVLVGPSGCGKSTLLRMIAGLEDANAGTIRVGGTDVTDFAPRHRDIAMVFQTYALYPHMTVRQNIGYGLKVRRTPKAEARRRVDEVAELLGLGELLERRPAQLSGGQRQRVAMGRAIVREPKAFLMDEPLSNLDAKLRVGMRASLAQLHGRLGVTTVYVTHDQIEAMTLGQRVAVMRDGRILQVDTPQRLYHDPVDLFVAGFIGTPAMNLVEARGRGRRRRLREHSPGARPVAAAAARLRAGRARHPARGVRGRGVRAAGPADARGDGERARGARRRRARLLPRRRARRAGATKAAGADTSICSPTRATLFTARVDPRTTARVGRRGSRSPSTRRASTSSTRRRATASSARPPSEPAAELAPAAG